MPNTSNAVEIGAYQAMRYLYARYRAGQIDREHARQEKREIRGIYDRDIMRFKIYADFDARYKALQPLLVEIEKSDNELCRRAVRIMDGRDRLKRQQK